MKTLITIFLALSLACQGQTIKYAATNVVSSSLLSGLGSGIHKHKDESFGHAFIQGAWKGAIGGAIQYSSKMVAAQIYHKQNYWFGLQSRVINSVGNSIIYSGCLNQDITSNYMIDFGFVHFQTNFKKSRAELNPCNLGMFAYELFFDKEAEFSVVKSVQTGVLFFNKKIDLSKLVEGQDVSFGNTVCNVMRVQKYDIAGFTEGSKFDRWQTAAHELVHTMQYEAAINILTLGEVQKIKHVNWDVPIWMAMYATANLENKKNNWYEAEAYWITK